MFEFLFGKGKKGQEIPTLPIEINFRDDFQGDWNTLQTFIQKRKNPYYKLTGFLNLLNTDSTTLGTLLSVDNSVNLSNSKITDLGSLETIGRELLLTNTNIKTLQGLKRVGSYIDAQGSNLTILR